jgi:O-acetylhomoserine (thiol)-lyase
MLAVNLKKFGIETSFVDATKPEAFAAAMRPNTRAVFAESLGNPSLVVLDIAGRGRRGACARRAACDRQHGASPFLCNPIRAGRRHRGALGHQVPGGHGTTLGGVIVESGRFPVGQRQVPRA